MSAAERPLLSVPDAARQRSIGKTALYAWIAAGDVPERCYLRLNGRLYVRRRAFFDWLDGGQSPQTTHAAEVPQTETPALIAHPTQAGVPEKKGN